MQYELILNNPYKITLLTILFFKCLPHKTDLVESEYKVTERFSQKDSLFTVLLH